ncbi:oxidoreductase-like protein [Lineolata rhizophorae]|uniref:Oxidoreductase-like protein n=1 Tax=Lineolata rhizophorae TaxID=578093 RepID=A0A6A6NYF8_9PEZI|nr:oxidoreductase-like protein [Lineolata rhizophorae]
MSGHNEASWIQGGKEHALKVGPTELYTPGPNEVLVNNYVVAINPIDWKVQSTGWFIKQWPMIIGCDSAGEIAAVGKGVTRLKVGQRVIAHSPVLATNEAKFGSFQKYSIADEILVAPIPDSITFEEATVLPSALTTSFAGLFGQKNLRLPYPPAGNAPPGSALLIWGGSTSIASVAIQVAVAAGYYVLSTASAHNMDYVKSLGASAVLDHRKDTVVGDVVAALEGKQLAGVYDAVGTKDSQEYCIEVLQKVGGGRLATVLDLQVPVPEGIQANSLFALSIYLEERDISDAMWRRWTSEALANGSLKCKPDPLVIGTGLDKIQEALDRSKAGVSAAKVVVKL